MTDGLKVRGSSVRETDLIDNQDLKKVTRITVVTDEGRAFEEYNAFESGVVLSIQDGGRTLKIFPGQVAGEKGDHID